MTLPDRNNPYSFDPFLEKARSFDFYRDDPFFQRLVKHFTGEQWPELHQRLLAFSSKASTRWRDLADQIARLEVRPLLVQYDGHNHRVDRIVRPMEALELEKEVLQEKLFSAAMPPWENLAKRYLLHQIGEACVGCPLACTEGLIALAEEFVGTNPPEVNRIVEHCKEGLDGDFGIGAQFMTEIQGGSDIPSNVLEAEPQGDHYRIYGTKFFCSAMHADYSVITAKVTGSEEVGTFIVPSWLPGNKALEKRNGYRINRLKWKLGTAELPTAEVEYDGALAYAVGPTDRGVANAVGIVLTLSRVSVAISSASAMTRAAREALLYSQFRDVFGRKIYQWSLAAKQLQDLVEAAQRTAAGLFKVYDLHIRLGRRLQAGLDSSEPMEVRRRRFDLRELIILQKMCTALETVDVLRKAISIFGGHGVIEDFSSLPRLFRDAMVNELWEGPRNVLLMQVFRDLQRVSSWYSPEEFTRSILSGAPDDTVSALGAELKEFLSKPPFQDPDPASMRRAEAWDMFCDTLFKTYQTVALNEVGKAPIIPETKTE